MNAERPAQQYVIRYRISVENKWQFLPAEGPHMVASMQLAERYSKAVAEVTADSMRRMRLARGQERAHLIVEVLPYTPGGAGEFRVDPYHRVGTILKPYHRADGTRRHSVEARAAWFPADESR